MEKAKTLEKLNEELRNVQKEWVEKRLKEYILELKKEDSAYRKDKDSNRNVYELSCPFCMGLTEEYVVNKDKKKKVMIIGQQPLGFGCWDEHSKDFDPGENTEGDKNEWSHIGLQNWAREYLKTQLSKNKENGIAYNPSPFWRLFGALKEDYVLCWNDIDKVYYGKKEEAYREGTLTYKAESFLSAAFEYEGKRVSLVKKEIEIARPDVVVFATGPSYAQTMAVALDYKPYQKKKIMNKSPKREVPVIDLESIKLDDKTVRVLWTYHPGYLTQAKYKDKNLFNEAIDKIKIFIEAESEDKS